MDTSHTETVERPLYDNSNSGIIKWSLFLPLVVNFKNSIDNWSKECACAYTDVRNTTDFSTIN